MSKTSIEICINEKTYKYDFAKFGFYAMATAESEYGLKPFEIADQPLSTMLSLFAFVAKMDRDEAGKEVDEHFAKGGEITDLLPLIEGFQNCSFFQSTGKGKK